MLSCQSCIRQCLQTLVGDYAVISSPLRTSASSATRHSRQSLRRTFATTAIREAAEDENEAAAYSSQKPKTTTYTNFSGNSARPKRAEWLESRGTTPEVKKRLQPKNLEKHLVYLKDPVKLADDIRRMLSYDEFDDALTTVRAASRDVQCTVSWNHLINWQMANGKMNAAIKTFNEMKKRAQVPDAITYTILFRGCAAHPDSKQALSKVMSIYQSMAGEFSQIKPTTIHLNAVLKACSRAKDMDALWAIAGDMPQKGVRTPNNLTYTTILNALRYYTVGDLRGDLSATQKRDNVQKALTLARKVWVDVIERWRVGRIFIDEELVCSMGRLLLIGTPEERNDIFSLLEQTMHIPRMVPRLGSSLINSEGDAAEIPIENVEHEEDEEIPDTELAVFEPLKTHKNGTLIIPGVYAKPGQNTLSLLMSAMELIDVRSPATSYWRSLVTDYHVEPDAENYAAYLRILRRFRSSTEATEIIVTIPREKLQLKHVILGMSTCYRDKNNPNAFVNSGKILSLMEQISSVPDVRVLEKYLDLAIQSPAYYSKTSSKAVKGSNGPQSDYALGQQIMRALERVEKSSINLKSELNYGSFASPPPKVSKPSPARLAKVELVADAISLWSSMIRAYDVCIHRALVPRDQYTSLSAHRNTLQAWISRYQNLNRREKVFIEKEQVEKKKLGAMAKEEGEKTATPEATAEQPKLFKFFGT